MSEAIAVGSIETIRMVGTGVILIAAELDGIGTVEDGTIVVLIAVEIEMDVAGETSVITKASGTSDRVAGEATIGTTLAVTVAEMRVVVVVAAPGMRGHCPSGCESWPGRTLVSEVEMETMVSSSLVAEETSVAVVIT